MNFIDCFSSFLIGFFGSAHCLGMCGSIILILSVNTVNFGFKKHFIIFLYNLGRIFSYSVLGLLLSFLGLIFAEIFGEKVFIVFKIIGGFSLILVGFYLTGYFKLLIYFEKYGFFLWNYISPITKKFLPVTKYFHAFLIGLIWGNLPCGLVYSALLWSISFNSIVKSFYLMFFFGLGTLPAMLLSGYFAVYIKKISNNSYLKMFVGFFMLIFGFFTIFWIFFNF